MARLIRTEKEVEGNYTEQWIVVEEDALDPWPAGALDTVGRPAARIDGVERARGEARYTADVTLPGMLHAAVLRSPHARARVAQLRPPRARSPRPASAAALGPGDAHVLTDGARSHEGAAVAAVAADTWPRRGPPLELLDVEWEPLEPLLDADEAVRRRLAARGAASATSAATSSAPSPRRTSSSTPSTARRRCCTTRWRPHQAVCEWHGDGRLDVHISTQWIWGVRRRVASELGLPRGQGARRLRVHGRRVRLQERPGRLHVHRGRARAPHRPARALRADPPRGEPRHGQPQRRRSSASSPAPRATGARRAGRRVRERRRLDGLLGHDRRADADALRLRERAHDDARREAEHAAERRLPRPRVRRGHVRARVPARRARREARARPARAAAPATTRTTTSTGGRSRPRT